MKQKLQALSELQKVDLEIAAAKKAAESHPKQIAELEKELAAARAAVEAERAKLTDVDQQKRSLEQQITEEKDTVKKWEARLTEQRSTREYSALAREIDIKRKATTTMQEQVAELTKALAAQREIVKARESDFGGHRDRIGGRITELKQKAEATGVGVKELESKRGQVAAAVDANLLRRYEAVRKKKLPAMAAVVAGTCQGCNMNIPPQQYNQLRTSLGADVCPSCNRIIYAVEAFDTPAK